MLKRWTERGRHIQKGPPAGNLNTNMDVFYMEYIRMLLNGKRGKIEDNGLVGVVIDMMMQYFRIISKATSEKQSTNCIHITERLSWQKFEVTQLSQYVPHWFTEKFCVNKMLSVREADCSR